MSADGFRTLRRMGQLLGYARVSTDLQDPPLQHDALTAAGVERVWTDHASGTTADRPELAAVLDARAPATSWWSGAWTGSGGPCST